MIYDDSKDNTLEIIENYARVDDRVKIIHSDKSGITGALNKGLKVASGEYIARMDADDVSMPDRFEQQIGHLISTGADVCGCHFFIIDEKGGYIDAIILPCGKNDIFVEMASGVPFAHGSVIIRTEFVRKNKLFYGSDEFKYVEDYDFWVRMYDAGAKFTNLNKWLYMYRVHEKSLSRILHKKVLHDAVMVSNKYIRGHIEEINDLIVSNDFTFCSRRDEGTRSYIIFILIIFYFKVSLLRKLFFYSQKAVLYGFFKVLRYSKELTKIIALRRYYAILKLIHIKF